VIDFLRQAAATRRCSRSSRRCTAPAPTRRSSKRWSIAARKGKDVTVVIELRARFDEEANIELANRLQEAGAHVMYGIVGYKTHAKMLLVVRREGERHPPLRAPRHRQLPLRARRAPTPTTACSPATRPIGEDVHEIFLQLTSLTQTPRSSAAAVALRAARGDDRRSSSARRERNARRAAGARHRQDERAGRAADDRGAVPRLAGRRADRPHRARHLRAAPRRAGISENIRVRSIVGRFLEHSACSISRTAASPRSTAPAPTGWSATSSAASTGAA
jgi:polyphosphate kinase